MSARGSVESAVRASDPSGAVPPPAAPKQPPFNPTWINGLCAATHLCVLLYTQCTSPLKSIDDRLKTIDAQIASAHVQQMLTDMNCIAVGPRGLDLLRMRIGGPREPAMDLRIVRFWRST